MIVIVNAYWDVTIFDDVTSSTGNENYGDNGFVPSTTLPHQTASNIIKTGIEIPANDILESTFHIACHENGFVQSARYTKNMSKKRHFKFFCHIGDILIIFFFGVCVYFSCVYAIFMRRQYIVWIMLKLQFVFIPFCV